jgi:hypothetical protein
MPEEVLLVRVENAELANQHGALHEGNGALRADLNQTMAA